MQPIVLDEPTNPSWERVTYAAHQKEYQPLTVARGKTIATHPVMSCWELSEEELAYIQLCISEGRPVHIYHEQWTFRNEDGGPKLLQPVQMWMGQPRYKNGPWGDK